MTAWLADWGPLIILCGIFALVAFGAMVADCLESHRARVDLHVAAQRTHRDAS